MSLILLRGHRDPDEETLRAIGEIRQTLDGRMFFERRGTEGRIDRTTHELWSVLSLRDVAETYAAAKEDGLAPVNRFARCVNCLFALVGDPDFRGAVPDGLGEEILADIDAEPGAMADRFLDDVFD